MCEGQGIERFFEDLQRVKIPLAEVVPPARIGKGVDAVMREQAADKAKEDEKTMQESKKETRWIVSGRIWLSCTTYENERQ